MIKNIFHKKKKKKKIFQKKKKKKKKDFWGNIISCRNQCTYANYYW